MYNFLSGLQMIESINAIEIFDEEKTINRSFKERFFTLPWTPWVKTKVIIVKKSRPAIFRLGNQLIYHPALKDRIMNSVIDWNAKS